MDFILSILGYAVGLGNVWRFPFLCYRNGGVSFLIPYSVMLVLTGLPVFLMELTLGQFSSQGPITVWKISPMFRGVGWGMIALSISACIYYNTVVMYSLYYMMVSFVYMDSDLPWTKCHNATWASKWCKDTPHPDFASMTNETEKYIEALALMNETCARSSITLEKYMNDTKTDVVPSELNSTMLLSKSFAHCKWKYTDPSFEYWSNYVLQQNESDSIGDLGGISWKNFVGLIFAWLIVFFCLMKGFKSSGKVVYFTATFPYVILTVLLIRGVTLPGYYEGIKYYIVPNSESWETLKDPKVWGDAATQIFFSLGVSFGGLIGMASYNKFKNNCYRDAVLVATINCFTSVYAGFAVFALLGFMAHVTNQSVKDVAIGGPGLAFVAYPAGIAQLPAAPIWGFLFFFMLITLGLDSMFVTLEAIISGITDIFPTILRKHKTLFTFICCCIGFLCAIPQTTKGGIYVMSLMDSYVSSFGLLAVALTELIAVSWVYGVRNLAKDFEMMIGHKPNIYWLATWFVISPAVIIFTLVMMAIGYKKASYGSYVFEDWAQGIGWIIVGIPIALIILFMVVEVVKQKIKGNRMGMQMSIGGAIRRAAHHTDDWGPVSDEHRQLDPARYAPLHSEELKSMDNYKTKPIDNAAFDDDEKHMSIKL